MCVCVCVCVNVFKNISNILTTCVLELYKNKDCYLFQSQTHTYYIYIYIYIYKQKLQILESLHIRNMQPTLNRINFQTSDNVLKCL